MSGIRKRIEELSPEKRRLLRERLRRGRKESGGEETDSAPPAYPETRERFDVVILGGGLAGLTLALQLRRSCPRASVLVVDRRSHPVPEAAHKIGESTVEVGARYLRDTLGLGEHLAHCQLRKGGMRFYFPAGDNGDITERVELGAGFVPPVGAYQLDRGRFENHLAREVAAAGASWRDGCRVRDVALGRGGLPHTVTLSRDGEEHHLAARWVIDATGRAGLLRRRLGLGRSLSHHCHAAWFRLEAVVDPDDWSDSGPWRQRVPAGLRRIGTNHLMGRGYWVWLIPLASGGTSVGIVVDGGIHSSEELRSFEGARSWLRRHEPQLAARVEARSDALLDFRLYPDYSYGCTRVFSADRWCLSGDSGAFADPLYSPGTDFIALANDFITDLVVRDLAGEPIGERTEAYDRIFLNSFESLLTVYEGLYPVMGNAQVMIAKVVWDFVLYWGFSGLLYFHDKLRDPEFMASVGAELQRQNHLNVRLQALFRDWDRLGQPRFRRAFIDFLEIGFLERLHHGLEAGLDDEGLRARIRDNAALLDGVAAGIFAKALAARPDLSAGPGRDLLALSLDAAGAAAAGAARPAPEVETELEKLWLDRVAERDPAWTGASHGEAAWKEAVS